MKIGNTRYMQYLAAITGGLTVTTSALYGTWSSPILPKIASGNTPLGNITNEQRSWIVSSLALGSIVGSVITGRVLRTFGRRGSLLLSGLPMLMPWFMVAFSSSVWLVCIARFIAGVACTSAVCALMLYNGEIAEKEIRGKLGSTFNILGLIGELVTLCIGPYISYTELSLVNSIVPLIFVVGFYFMPESPYYLVKVGKESEAIKNLKRLLRNDVEPEELEEQIGIIRKGIEEETIKEASLWDFLSKKEYRKSLFLGLGIKSLLQLSGYAAISAYMQTIIQYGKSSISPETSSTICGLIQFPAVLTAAAIADKAGRKPLIIISSLGCALALILEGVYFYLQDVVHADTTNISWMPTFGMILYVIMRPIGIGTMSFVLLGELFSANIKEHAISVVAIYSNILDFAVAKSFQPISSAWGPHVVFAFYSIICILGSLFVYFVVPETKNKTLAEIQEKLNRKSKKVHYNPVRQL